MIQAYADGALVYDSRLGTHKLLGLTYTGGLNKAGTASLVLPPDHPKYEDFTSYRTLVEIYRDNVLVFRGRALYPADDFYKRRTITCEGERGFFRDAVMRPYMYQDGPAAIFANVIGLYNAQVEAFKQFVVGEVTVTDANNYIRLENTQAEQVADTIDKLVERCGGYIVFTTNAEGQRVVNWYAELGYRSSQTIEFGKNLTDFARTDTNEDLATVIIPYGAKIEEEGATEGSRVTIESVNDGLDFLQDYDAVALRGVIAKPVYWDDVTEPANLLAKAQAYLASSRNLITSLTLTAVDLSDLDKSIDSFQVGDLVRVRSKPHGVDEDFLLSERTVDLLNPAAGSIVLGKDRASLTGMDVAGDRKSSSELHQIEHDIRADYKLNIAAAVEETKQSFSSLIQQTSELIKLEVSESFATSGEIEELISTSMTQLSDSFNFLFTNLEQTVNENDANAREQFIEIEKYIRFEGGDILLGEVGNSLTLRIENDRIAFIDDGAEVAYFSNKHLVVLDGNFLNSLQIGKFALIPRGNGNLSLVKVGD